jgi:acyl carrier protein
MNTIDFLRELEETLELETTLDRDTVFQELDEWDSLNTMVLMSYVSENFGVNLTSKDFEDLSTIESLINRIGADKFV